MKERSCARKEPTPSLRDTHPEAASFVIDHHYALLEALAMRQEGYELYPEEAALLAQWDDVCESAGDRAAAFLTNPTLETPQEAVGWVQTHATFVEDARRKLQEMKVLCTTGANRYRQTSIQPVDVLSLNEEALLRTARSASRMIGRDAYQALVH